MKKRLLLSLFPFLILACNDSEETREEDMLRLQQLRTELIELAESATCENSSEWDFIGIGAKACGGPSEYIAYPKSISIFLDRATSYTEQSDAFNRKWDIISDCAIAPAPSGVVCEGGKAELLF